MPGWTDLSKCSHWAIAVHDTSKSRDSRRSPHVPLPIRRGDILLVSSVVAGRTSMPTKPTRYAKDDPLIWAPDVYGRITGLLANARCFFMTHNSPAAASCLWRHVSTLGVETIRAVWAKFSDIHAYTLIYTLVKLTCILEVDNTFTEILHVARLLKVLPNKVRTVQCMYCCHKHHPCSLWP